MPIDLEEKAGVKVRLEIPDDLGVEARLRVEQPFGRARSPASAVLTSGRW